MKKIAVALLLILLACLLLAGCGIKSKIEQKIGEKIVEKVVEGALSSNDAKVDIDGGKITVKGKDGESVIFGGGEWPDVDYLPEFKKGQILTSTNDSEGNVMIVFEKVEQKDFEDYLKSIKKAFPEETYDVQSEEYLLFEGKNSKGQKAILQYFTGDKSLTIIGKKSD